MLKGVCITGKTFINSLAFIGELPNKSTLSSLQAAKNTIKKKYK
jgi:hypothetical protein